MAFETAETRLGYVTTFGESVNFTLGMDDWDALGIFDNEFVDVDGVESRRPVLICRIKDIYLPAQQEDWPTLPAQQYRATAVQVTQGGYNIVEVQPDGTGMVMLVLELQ